MVTCARGGRATQRCHNSPRWRNGVTGCEWRHAPEVRGGLWEIWRKWGELKTRRQTRRFDFWGSLTRDEFARRGCRAREGPDEEANIKRLCLSPYVETFNSKVIKRFRTWTKKSLRVFEFRDSYVLYMFYRYEHYMSISHVALIVAIVQHICGPRKKIIFFYFHR